MERIFLIKTDQGFEEPPVPAAGFLIKTLRRFKSKLICLSTPTVPVTAEAFLAARPSRKRKIYEQANEDLKIREVCRSDAKWATFLKKEKVNLTEKPDPVPRLINPRSPRYNLMLGLFIKPAESTLYRAIDALERASVVAKGRNAVERGQMLRAAWEGFSNPLAIGIDVSRFDQHVSRQALEWEHSVYLSLFGNDPTLRRLLSWQLENYSFARSKTGGISFSIEGCRGSGDMNTAIGNVLLMCGMLWSFRRYSKIPFKFVDDGDDAVVMMERRYEKKFYKLCKPWFLEMGFTIKYESSTVNFEQIDFCQSRPVWDGARWVMCRDPRTALCKDLICVRGFNSAKQWKQYMGSVGLSGLALAGNIPIFWKYYACFQPSGNRELESGLDYLAKGMEVKSQEPTAQTRYSFWLSFGISPEEQIAIESSYEVISAVWATPAFRGNTIRVPSELFNSALKY